MNLLLRPVRLANGIDEEAMLVFGEDERLLAILTHLGDEHGASSGHWFLEVAFGRFYGREQPTFPDLDAAQNWIKQGVPSNRGTSGARYPD
jgi:hypothetical protein